MSWDSSSLPAIRGRLARHLGRLQQNLDTVAEQVREAIAHAVGRTAAEAIGEAVYAALCPREGAYCSFSHSSYSGRASTRRAWDDDPAWERDAARSDWRDRYDYDDYQDSRYDDDPEPAATPARQNQPGARRYRRAIAAGLQAAAWWLQRHPGQVSLLAALTVGAVTGLAVLASHVSSIAGLMASALGLAYVLDLMRSAGWLFGQHDRA